MKNNFSYISLPADCNCIAITDYTGNEEKIIIPEKIDEKQVREINGWVFYANNMVKEITIPNGVTSIGSHVFADCHKLEKVTLPDTIRKISFNAFTNCISLKTIVCKGTEEQWNKMDLLTHINLFNVDIKFDKSSKLSEFLNNCKDAEEIRKE